MAKEKMDIELKKCQTPEFRASFVHVFETFAFKNQKPQYSMTMLFPKNVSLKALEKAAFNAATEMWGDKEDWPENYESPFKNGDGLNKKKKPHPPEYAGCRFVVAKSKKRKPGVLGPKRDKDTGQFPVLTSEAEFDSGDYARANLLAFAYEHESGNCGVSFHLQGIQKTKDGEKFGGGVDIQKSFDEVVDESDMSDNYEDTDADMGF